MLTLEGTRASVRRWIWIREVQEDSAHAYCGWFPTVLDDKDCQRRHRRYDYVDIRYMGDACIALDYGTGGNVENDLYHNSMKVPVLSETVRINRAGGFFIR